MHSGPEIQPVSAVDTSAFSPYSFFLRHRAMLLSALAVMLIDRLAKLVLPFLSKFLIDDVIGQKHLSAMPALFTVLAAAGVAQLMATYLSSTLLNRSGEKAIAELRDAAQKHVMRLPIAYHDSQPVGGLVAQIMADAEGIRGIMGTLLMEFIGSVVTALIVVGVLFYLNPRMTAVVFVYLLIFIPSFILSNSTLRPLQKKRLQMQAELTGSLNESLSGIRVIKAYRKEEQVSSRLSVMVQRLPSVILDNLRGVVKRQSWGMGMTETVSLIVTYIGVQDVLRGAMSLGAFFTFTAFLRLMSTPFVQIIATWNQITQGITGVNRVRALLSERPERTGEARAGKLGRIAGEVRFENVSFAYEPGKPVLKNVSFVASPGSVTAIIGHSGAGKSTMANLLNLFYAPTEGVIRVDGHDLATVDIDSYRSQLGIVLQDTFLFNGTIRENILFARPEATQAEFEEACSVAYVDEFVSQLENGYETQVAERGVKLSGGQRQRIALARAIVASPRILILDEATSNIDWESENRIEESLSRLARTRTTFVISHRLFGVRHADQIIVLEHGRVAESGTHESLLRLNHRYSDFCLRQQVPALRS